MPVEEIGGAGEARRQLLQDAGIAAPEPARRVPVAIVPFGPAGTEIAELVTPGADVPRLRDQLDAGEQRVLAHRRQKRARGIEAGRGPGERGGEIEAKTVDMHHLHPIAEAVHHHLKHARMLQVEAVAGAGVVDVMARVVGLQPVIGRVVDAAETQGGAELIALAGMVVNHVQNHLDAGVVEPAHQDLELGDQSAREVTLLRREEPDRVVAPIIHQAVLHQPAIIDEGVHGQQLDRRDAERAEVLDDLRTAHARGGAAQLVGHGRVRHREAAQIHLVDHRLVPGTARVTVVAPAELGLDDTAFRHAAGVVPAVEGEIGAWRAGAIAEMRIVPFERAVEGASVGIEHQFVRVEPVPAFGLVGSVDAIAIKQAGAGIRQIAVPDLVRALRQRYAGDLARAAAVEETELHLLGVRREQREVDAGAVPGRAQRRRTAGPDSTAGRG